MLLQCKEKKNLFPYQLFNFKEHFYGLWMIMYKTNTDRDTS